MCGIIGYFNLPLPEKERVPLLRRMSETIQYRGPDDEGYYVDDLVGLGIRRLSIIDLHFGHQPMETENGRFHIVFNGEIYNFRDVRESLQKKGCRFVTASDTEVILQQFAEEGERGLERLNGMFAMAIWDKKKHSLFLARDRMGVKPLYYFWDGKHFLFASEIKAILASAMVGREIEDSALWDYLTFRFVPQPQTIWRNIHKLLPGHFLTLSKADPTPVIRPYWQLPVGSSESGRFFQAHAKEFEDLFLDAVRVHLVADVPVGVLLSGGLDSSSVAAAIQEVHKGELHSFSVAFAESPETDELPFAREVARSLNTTHHEVIITRKDFLDFLPNFVHYMDEPMADLASVPLYYVSRLAHEYVKVVLSGEGSDEILGGYDLDRLVAQLANRKWLERIAKGCPGLLMRGLSCLWPELPERLEKIKTPNAKIPGLSPMYMTNLFSSTEKTALFKSGLVLRESLDSIRELYRGVEHLEPIQQILYVYCHSWLVEDLLMKADRMTMANSIELRVPFLDYRIVEWAGNAPAWIKVGKSGVFRYETKRVLREFARKRLPPEILSRPKQGFPVPCYDWLKGPMKSWAHDLLCAGNSRLSQWFAMDRLRNLISCGTRPESSRHEQAQLWQMLILELWFREWLPS